MMKTTKCSECSSISQVWTSTRTPVQIIDCDTCKARPAAPAAQGAMAWTLEAHATRTQFAPARISR